MPRGRKLSHTPSDLPVLMYFQERQFAASSCTGELHTSPRVEEILDGLSLVLTDLHDLYFQLRPQGGLLLKPWQNKAKGSSVSSGVHAEPLCLAERGGEAIDRLSALSSFVLVNLKVDVLRITKAAALSLLGHCQSTTSWGLIDNRRLFLPVLEPRNLRSGCRLVG